MIIGSGSVLVSDLRRVMVLVVRVLIRPKISQRFEIAQAAQGNISQLQIRGLRTYVYDP